ncbi:hypothetical protein AMJ40_01765 [candidate division TA06 bacterium DG_26]|uniref:Dockerin domain-containing protein n=1 Tax=candidate division TA06 bacterium DG_26 TaxID=1703771 RepID=A0A0S7WKU8_UNCT6|nr:MAG: hypothetical protein AMJ40_01765 [candidate division TA06 bacterium DG_26]
MWRRSLVQALLVTVVSLAVGASQHHGKEHYAIEDIELLRWVDPLGREPMTYEEYAAMREETEEFRIDRAYDSGTRKSDSSLVAIIVHNALYPSIHSSLLQYVSDIEADGYSVSLYTTSGGAPVDLRTFLQGLPPDSLVGSLLVGDLPVAWYEMDEWEHEEFPIDLYYMDLDGTWGDGDSDGIFDAHGGSLEPDIWIGRLTASPCTLGGADEVSLLQSYFQRNHQYRAGATTLPKRALLYIDDDWAGSDEEWSQNLGLAYWERTVVADSEITMATDYSMRLDDGYELIQVCAHSSPWVHAFKYASGADWDHFNNFEILQRDPQAFFYNLFACSNARYVEVDYMGGWYVFNPAYGLAALGSTKTGSMLYFDEFYGPLRENKTLGEAFKEWFAKVGEQSRPWFYGMTLLGDPLLDLGREIAVASCTVDDDMVGESSGDGSETVDPGETIELHITLRNRGREILPSVAAVLTTTDPFVTVVDGNEEYGDIYPDSSAASLDDFDFSVLSSCPRGHHISFTLSVSAANGCSWIDGLALVVEEPVVCFFAHTVVDTATGNGDMNADPGETVDMDIILANTGLGSIGSGVSGKVASVSAELSTADPQVTIHVGTAQFGTILPGDTVRSTTPFSLTVDGACPAYHLVQFSMEITAGGWYTTADSFSLAIGENWAFYDNMEQGASGWSHDFITPGYLDEWHLTSQRNHTLGGGSSWKCGDDGPDPYSNYLDAGLVTPEIAVGEASVLSFWHWIDAETASDNVAWDGAIVEVNDGSGWQQIEPREGYPYTIIGGAEGPFPEGTPCFSGTYGWSDTEFDLSGYSGQVRFRFRFGSDMGVAKEGWYIDDITIWGFFFDCGDVNGDGRVTVADATYLVGFIYRGGSTPCGDGDVNNDGRFTIADALYIVTYVYRGGPAPCEPPSRALRSASRERDAW